MLSLEVAKTSDFSFSAAATYLEWACFQVTSNVFVTSDVCGLTSCASKVSWINFWETNENCWRLSTSAYLFMLNLRSTSACPCNKANIKMHIFHKLLQFLLLCKKGSKRQSICFFESWKISQSLKTLVERKASNSSFLSHTVPEICLNWNDVSHSSFYFHCNSLQGAYFLFLLVILIYSKVNEYLCCPHQSSSICKDCSIISLFNNLS